MDFKSCFAFKNILSYNRQSVIFVDYVHKVLFNQNWAFLSSFKFLLYRIKEIPKGIVSIYDNYFGLVSGATPNSRIFGTKCQNPFKVIKVKGLSDFQNDASVKFFLTSKLKSIIALFLKSCC